jgi:hypothetical protein
MSSSKCSCTPGYTCRELSFSNDVLHKKKPTQKNGIQLENKYPNMKKKLDFLVIAISIAKWAYMEGKKCCSGNLHIKAC